MKLNKLKIIPKARYINAKLNKDLIYKENKCGVYCWNNLITGKIYIGSSTSLYRRFRNYFSLEYIKNVRGSSLICKALLKYGFYNFSLDILEYCESSDLIKREQYYIDLLKPEYNILKVAGSNFGYKHRKDTILKMKNRVHSEKSKAKIRATANNRIITEETKAKWRVAARLRRGVKRGIEFSINLSKVRRGIKYKSHIKYSKNINKNMKYETKLKLSSRVQGVNVRIFDRSNNFIKEFTSMTSAAKYIGVDRKTISKIFETGVSYDDFIYKFEIKDSRVWVYDSNQKLIKIFSNVKKASEWSNVPFTTLSRYIKSGKLYKNKFYFYKASSISNPYFKNNS